MKPSYWGKYFWKVMHITALGYPDNPSEDDKQVYRRFFETIGQVLPCKKCSKNYASHFENVPITKFLDGPESLFKWTVYLHNIVNKELGKPQWSIEFAESHYKAEEQKEYQSSTICTTTVPSTIVQSTPSSVVSQQQPSSAHVQPISHISPQPVYPVYSIILVLSNLMIVILIVLFLLRKR